MNWYRTPVPKGELSRLTERSNVRGFIRTTSFIGLLGMSAAAALICAEKLPLYLIIPVFLVHGVFYSFLLNGFHELSHNTVFKTRGLNQFFYRAFGLLSWNNPVFFSTSHKQHHLHTLWEGLDREVELPVKVDLTEFLLRGIINPLGFFETLAGTIRLSLNYPGGKQYGSLGSYSVQWKKDLFPPENQAGRNQLVFWARITLLFHMLLTAVFLASGYWMIPIVVSLAPFYGSGLLYFLNPTQHTGLTGNVWDYRLNSRTILLGPILRYLYWNMNYHMEHHMYAAVPCYNLQKLHHLIRNDTPVPVKGLIRTWITIRKVQKRAD